MNKKRMINIDRLKKCICICMSCVMVLTGTAFSFGQNEYDVMCATYEDINSSSVFLKQKGSDTCTLVSTVMMIRRALIMKGNKKWKDATESSVGSVAWNDGLAWNFSFMGVSVGHETLPAASDSKKELLKRLLKEHPEGIVLYYQGKKNMHAVLLTEYTNGKFYCAEPAGTEKGVIPLSHAFYVTASNATSYWYIKDKLPALTTYSQSEASLNIAVGSVNDASSGEFKELSPVLTFAGKNANLIPSNYKKLRVTGVELATKKKGKITVNWEKQEGVTGYKIQYSRKAGFSSYSEKRIKSGDKTSAKLKNLVSGKKYYVRICAYTKLENGTYLHYRYSQKKNIIVK